MKKKRKGYFWGDIQKRSFPKLKRDMEAKHLIVGGGIAGLFAAYYLYKYGEKNIVLIEQHTIGSGSTGFSAGMLVSEPETASWSRLVSRYGKGYGDVKRSKVYPKEYVHAPHLRSIIRFLKRVFPKTELAIEYAWSARYALSKTALPSVLKKNNVTRINGAGTQLASITAASYAVSKLLGKKHPLDSFFSD